MMQNYIGSRAGVNGKIRERIVKIIA